jgi:foldase protein PrsA
MIEAMKIGEVSQPLRTTRGYQILKLETSNPKQTLAFEPAREQIADRVLGDKRRREFLKYLDKLRAQAIIEWKNEDIKKAYEEGLNRQAAAGSAPTTPSH